MEISREIHERFVGQRLPILTTEPGKAGTTLARTDAYRQVVLTSEEPIGEFGVARILAGREADLIGELISAPRYRRSQGGDAGSARGASPRSGRATGGAPPATRCSS